MGAVASINMTMWLTVSSTSERKGSAELQKGSAWQGMASGLGGDSVLDAADERTEKVVIHPDHGGDNQRWRFQPLDPDFPCVGRLVAKHEQHMCLVGSEEAGARVGFEPLENMRCKPDSGCTRVDKRQVWSRVDMGDDSAMFMCLASGLVLGVEGRCPQENRQYVAVQQPNTQSLGQRWVLASEES